MVFASHNFFRAHFARAAGALVDGLAAGDECRRALNNIKNIRVVLVDFDFARAGSAASLNFEIVCGEQWPSFGKSCIDLLMIEMNDGGFLCLFGGDYSEEDG